MDQELRGERPPDRSARGADASPAELVALIIRLAQDWRERLTDRSAGRGLNEPRFGVLRAIASSQEQGCTQKQIASELCLSESNVCALIERMRAAGLLFRFRSKKDRRCSVLLLTDAGKELVEILQAEHAIEAERILSVLSPARQRDLHEILRTLSHHVDRNKSAETTATGAIPVAEPAKRRAS